MDNKETTNTTIGLADSLHSSQGHCLQVRFFCTGTLTTPCRLDFPLVLKSPLRT